MPRNLPALGVWQGEAGTLDQDLQSKLHDLRQTIYVVQDDQALAVTHEGTATLGAPPEASPPPPPEIPSGIFPKASLPLAGFSSAMSLTQLGDASFCQDHNLKLAYMTGAMANGIASEEIVIAAAGAGMLGSFGAAGLSLQRVEQAIDRIRQAVGDEATICFNLIHSPNEPDHEAAVVELFLRREVRLIEASAYLDLTLPVVRYRVAGIYQNTQGRIITPNRIIAKASRTELATKWFSPPPEKMLEQLIADGKITPEQAELASQIPMAQDLTAEADSGGHTDNRPAITLVPTMVALRDRMQHQYDFPLRVGAAGGIATPASAAAALAMGAAYLVTGSVNQACVESGSCDHVREMLAQTQQADVTMAPAADMFEMGVKLQVLKRGSMFPMRAAKLYELYRAYSSLEEIPIAQRQMLEKTIFLMPLETVWQTTRAFFLEREPRQIHKADKDPKHKMALVFRWYLGLSSRWANVGDPARKLDYQVWCGPAMGAFNEWTKDSFLADPGQRDIVTVGLNLLFGAALTTRLNILQNQGVHLDPTLKQITPQTRDQLEEFIF